MKYVKVTYDSVTPTDPATGNLVRFVEVSGAPTISAYRGSPSALAEARLGSVTVNTYSTNEEAVSAATEMAEAIGDIVYEVPTT